MGIILMPGIAGGGHDLDVITATAGDVVAGKVIVDKDGNPLTGTLALTGNAGGADVRNCKSFYSTDPKTKQTGSMREKGAATYTPNTANQVIAANQYLTGAQTILGDADLVAGNILYGKKIFGVAGNARKYAYWYGEKSTVGSKSFTNTGGSSSNLPYLSWAPGFTPLVYAAIRKNYYETSVSTGWNTVFVGAGVNANKGFYDRSQAPASSSSLVIPVTVSGTYNVMVAGYY